MRTTRWEELVGKHLRVAASRASAAWRALPAAWPAELALRKERTLGWRSRLAVAPLGVNSCDASSSPAAWLLTLGGITQHVYAHTTS